MNSEEKFKKSLQEIIESKQFVFNENDWAKAAEIIDLGKKQKNRKGLFFILSGLLLFTGFLIYFIGSALTETTLNKATAVSKSNNQTPAISKEHLNLDHTPKSSSIPVSESSATSSSAAKQHAEERSPEFSERQRTKAPLPPKTQSTPAALIQQSNPLVTPDKTTQTKTTADLKRNTLVQSGSALVPEQLAAVTKVAAAVTETKKENTDNKAMQVNNTTNAPAETGVKTTIPAAPITSSENSKIAKENPSIAAVPEKTSEAPAKLTASPEDKKEDVAPVAETAQKAEETAVAAVNPFVPAKTDTLKKPADSLLKPGLVRNFLNFELGGAYLFGYNNPGKRDANGLNAVMGINFYSCVAPKMYFAIGVQYNSVRNLSFSNRSSKIIRYKLGEEAEVTTITPTTIHYLSIPFKFQYQPNNKNGFGIGYTLGYLLNVESKVETYSERLNQTLGYESYTTAGYTEGINLFDSQLTLFYRRQLYGELWLNAEGFIGLSDVKQNTFFKSDVKEKNNGIKLTLSYNLFKH